MTLSEGFHEELAVSVEEMLALAGWDEEKVRIAGFLLETWEVPEFLQNVAKAFEVDEGEDEGDEENEGDEEEGGEDEGPHNPGRQKGHLRLLN
jgi:hypothetical protein